MLKISGVLPPLPYMYSQPAHGQCEKKGFHAKSLLKLHAGYQ